MNFDLDDQFHEDGFSTELFDAMLGNPRDVLVRQLSNPISQMERDILPMLIDVLDSSAADRKRAHSEMFFRERNR
jgi:hypothetical protein